MSLKDELADKWKKKLPDSFATVEGFLGTRLSALPEELRSGYRIDKNGLIRRKGKDQVPLRLKDGILEIHPDAYDYDETELVVMQIKMPASLRRELEESAKAAGERMGKVVHIAEILRAGAKEQLAKMKARAA